MMHRILAPGAQETAPRSRLWHFLLACRLLVALSLLTGQAASAALTLTLSAGAVESCGTVEATVGLSPAPATPATVALSANSPALSLPATAVIPANATSTKVTLTGLPVRADTPVTVTATHAGATATASLTVTPYPKPGYAYVIEDLGTLGGEYSIATGINGAGQVVGYGPLASGLVHAFRTGPYGPSGPLVDLDPDNPDEMVAWDVNDPGQITGYSAPVGGKATAFRAETDGTIRPLATPGQTDAEGLAINGNGQVAGTFKAANGKRRAFVTNPAGTVSDLGLRPGGTFSAAAGINAAGRVSGYGDDASEFHIGFLTSGGGGTVATATILGDYVYPYDVNYSGRATGEMFNYDDGLYHLFRTRADGSPQDLGRFGPFEVYGARINTFGAIAGTAYTYDNETQRSIEEVALYYSDALGLVDLNTLIDPEAGWDLVAANDINDAGQIVGFGRHAGAWRAYRLTPLVPDVLYGDADADGFVEMPDVVALLRMAAGIAPHGNPIVSDVAPAPACNPRGFGDGYITLADALRVARYIAGKEPVWP